MKKLLIPAIILLSGIVSCRKEVPNYPEGYDRIYYSYFDYIYDDLGNPTLSSQTITLDKASEDQVEIGVKFMSAIERDFDIEVRMYIRNSSWFLSKMKAGNLTQEDLAVPGVDFTILDEEGNALTPVRTDSLMYYSLTFPNAKKETRKLYLKSLNNQVYQNQRYAWLSLCLTYPSYETEEELKTNVINHVEDNYQVNTITKSWLRSIIIK